MRSPNPSGSKGLSDIFALFFSLIEGHNTDFLIPTPIPKWRSSLQPDMALVAKVLWRNAKGHKA